MYGLVHTLLKENARTIKYSLRRSSILVRLIALKCQMRWWIKEFLLLCMNQRWD